MNLQKWIKKFYGKFNWWIFSLFCQSCQKFCFEKLAKNSSLTGDISAVFSKFTKFPVAIVSWGGDKRLLHIKWSHDQWVTWLGRWDTLTLNQKGYSKSNRTQWKKYVCITNWGKLVLQIGAALFYYKLG